MKNLTLLLFGCIALFHSTNTQACGYAWISDCASQVQLRINGTLDSFDIAACPAGFNFDGIQLGTLQSFSLANAKTITWESCQNNVSAVFLKYRVYEQGGNTGNWQSLTLQQYHQTIDGPYTTRYNSAPGNISLTNGLTIGKTYFLEVYFLAEIDTIGDDYIPETTLLKDNNGANYKMSFTYGGPAAAPILLLPHLTEPSCHGANDGHIYVSAYGNISGLFYTWSNISLNFFHQFNLSAGNYSITVTNSIGETASATMQLEQPEPLQAYISNVQSLGCNNSPGFAQVMATGGTEPYQFLWQTGQQTDTATFTTSGTWAVTVTDTQQCSKVAEVFVGQGGLVDRALVANICAGEIYTINGQVFSAAGDYSFTIPGIGGCDTLVHLTLHVLAPADALIPLPDSIQLTCLVPQINLCATALPAALYQWEKDGISATATPCLLATAGGNYTLHVSLGGCNASKTIFSSEHLFPVPAQVTGNIYPNCAGGLLPAWLVAHTDADSPVFAWVHNGDTLSTNDSCFFQVTQFQGGQFVFPTLSITDKYGCENDTPTFNVIAVQLGFLMISSTVTPASSNNAADGSITVAVLGGLPPYNYSWDNGGNSMFITGLSPGTYCVTITDNRGCTTTKCHLISGMSGISAPPQQTLHLFPNPVQAGTGVSVNLPETLQGEKFQLDLMDEQGRVLSSEIINNALSKQLFVKIPLNYHHNALLLRLKGSAQNYVAKIVVHNP